MSASDDQRRRQARQLACHWKIRYATWQIAMDQASQYRKRRHFSKWRPLYPYQCQHCGEWHLSSKLEINK